MPTHFWQATSGARRADAAARAEVEGKVLRSMARGPWSIAPIYSKGVQIGWNGTCKRHSNIHDQAHGECRKKLTVSGMSSEGTQARIKMRLLRGRDTAADDVLGREKHMKMDPRELDLWDAERIKAMKPDQ